MDLKSRLIEFIEHKGLSVQSFEIQCNLSNGAVSKMGNNTRRSTIDKISKSYPDLNTTWLLTGEGNMLLNNSDLVPQKSFTVGVPYYNVDFIGGFDLVLNDQTTTPEYLIDFKKYNEATCWCNVTGHSMEPEITHGDIIALKKIEDKSFLPLGEVYAIVTTNGMRTIKRLGPSSDPKCYTLVPTNKSPEYGIQELPKNMIEHIFQVLGCMKRL
ncbi:S24 family peptidase [Bacteroides ndongoniae]|jgi:SOS-response transcriptional repressor LexA|uniref:S24 family peptidase n=1 Tax=Bacteroides ndongoniae TaxID=1903262 RepID=UPI0023F9457A|nr:S24 family peptidase [Bacteroides ndongoniae]